MATTQTIDVKSLAVSRQDDTATLGTFSDAQITIIDHGRTKETSIQASGYAAGTGQPILGAFGKGWKLVFTYEYAGLRYKIEGAVKGREPLDGRAHLIGNDPERE